MSASLLPVAVTNGGIITRPPRTARPLTTYPPHERSGRGALRGDAGSHLHAAPGARTHTTSGDRERRRSGGRWLGSLGQTPRGGGRRGRTRSERSAQGIRSHRRR
jgi:hypothetical protein